MWVQFLSTILCLSDHHDNHALTYSARDSRSVATLPGWDLSPPCRLTYNHDTHSVGIPSNRAILLLYPNLSSPSRKCPSGVPSSLLPSTAPCPRLPRPRSRQVAECRPLRLWTGLYASDTSRCHVGSVMEVLLRPCPKSPFSLCNCCFLGIS